MTSGIYSIPYLSSIYDYIFDEEGNAQTGLTKYNGNTFYLLEGGLLEGTMYTGDITLGDTLYSFNVVSGALVSAMSLTEGQ